ncbi:glycosyltransferase family 4 protein [Psychroserpens algicola]|uniref:Glycosyltransferase family 4 protein n=1 Tax=Psychroserpens algicola TaxID=1719034 RepID=A0ABT0H6V1_9FLAO|nr:glycosyltransferase family 4 protein [Psychroserpens algicola]
MNNKLKIAIYSGEIPSTTFIERLIQGLSHKNCEILLFGRVKKKPSYRSNILIKGYKSGRIQKGIYLVYYSVLLTLFRSKDKQKLDAILKTNNRTGMYDKVKCYPVLWHQPDIFHVQWAKGIHEWDWVKAFGMKLIVSLRGAHINYSPIADVQLAEVYRTHFPNVDAFHAVSEAIAKEAQKYGAQKDKIKVIYSGLDLDVFNTTEMELSLQNDDTFNVISVGRPHWKKGYGYALDAFKLLKDQNFKFTYTIVGGLNLELEYQLVELGLENDVISINHVPFHKVQQLIKSSDLLLLPSTEEGVANVVLEAMAAQKLVLTTNCGGMEEAVIDGENGFVVPIRNVQQMAKKIQEISQMSETQIKNLTDNALATIKKQHTENLMVEGMFDLYQYK